IEHYESVGFKAYCFLDGHPEGRGGEDLSSQFNTANPPFIDLTDGNSRMPYGNEKGTAVLGGSSQSDIYLIGGTQVNLYQP
ncbi:5279_t:CDS:2, partial [Gigaspora rosea]